MTPLLLLAEKVEGLEGFDHETDQRLFCVEFGWDYPLSGASYTEWREVGSPSYTSSVDAAMRLVPEGWYWSIKQYPRVGCVAEIGGIYAGKAHTPALALVAASLRARAAMEAGE